MFGSFWINLLAIVVSLLVIFKIFFKLTTRWNKSRVCLVGKTAIVTGANSGIGFYTAQDFAMRGAKVILACRNKDKAEEARKKIINSTNNPNVFVKILDLASFKSVRAFAEDINTTEERLDILVNNAGIADTGDSYTVDGLLEIMQINYFSPFLLTNLLISLLKKSSPSRVVNVSSLGFIFAKLDTGNLNSHNKNRNYVNSKLLNIYFSCELARKLEGTGVVSNCLHPGAVNTGLFETVPMPMRLLLKLLVSTLFKNCEEGAQTTLHVSLSKELENVSGQYFDNCEIAWLLPIPEEALNKSLIKKIWDTTEQMVNLAPEEKQF